MFKKTITYTDFNGDSVAKDFYFHMSKAELLEMATDGAGMHERLEKIIAANNGKEILREFRMLIESSCGIRSDDGQRFMKTPEAQSELLDSPAFDELLMELCTKTDAAVQFVQQLIPQSMQDEMRKQLEKGAETHDPFQDTDDPRPEWMKEHRIPSKEEFKAMPEYMKLASRPRE